MKIIVTTFQVIPHQGGLSTHLTELVEGLGSRGHDVRVLHGGDVNEPTWARRLYRIGALGRLDAYKAAQFDRMQARGARRTLELLGGCGADVIHAHDPFAAAAVMRSGARVPLVLTIHGPLRHEARQHREDRLPRFFSRLLRAENDSFQHAARLIAVDTGQRNFAVAECGVPPERVSVVFNSVQPEALRRMAARPSPLEPLEPYFVAPRRLVPKTGVRHAIEALAALPQPDALLLIAGDGEQREELRRLARELGVAKRVRLLGNVPRAALMPLVARSVATLVPSVPIGALVEATSLAVMEAMALGSVAIASAIGGLAELIENERTGLLAPPGDSAALARQMQRVLSDAPLRARLTSAGRRQADEVYSAAGWLTRIEQVYAAARAGDGGTVHMAQS